MDTMTDKLNQLSDGRARQYTQKEVRELFLKRIWQLVETWDTEEYSQRYKLEALAFSILDELDSGYAVKPLPNRDRAQNIAGGLSKLFHACAERSERKVGKRR